MFALPKGGCLDLMPTSLLTRFVTLACSPKTTRVRIKRKRADLHWICAFWSPRVFPR